jgi:hypothetical protein
MMNFLRTNRVLSVFAVENLRYFPTPSAQLSLKEFSRGREAAIMVWHARRSCD